MYLVRQTPGNRDVREALAARLCS